MTKEEAIQWLNGIEDKYIHGGDDDFDAKRKQALDMAIEALKAQDRPIICPRCGRTFAESEGRD